MYPSYLNFSPDVIKKRTEKVLSLLNPCQVCPRNCKINRLKDERGFCQLGRKPMVSSSNPHFGEETCLVGTHGSGTIFFTHCNQRCIYCQNFEISQLGYGREIEEEELAQIMIDLQNMGCHNINLVTPTPQVPQILSALFIAIKRGLKLPLVYNTSGYDSLTTLKLLDGIVDIYMPDFKYSDEKMAQKYSSAPKYPQIVKAAIREMHRQVGDLKIDKDGIAIRGLLVRHLVLPKDIAGTKEVVEFLAKEISKNTFLNVMDQYRPCYRAKDFPPLNRRITDEEYQRTRDLAKKAGIRRIYPF